MALDWALLYASTSHASLHVVVAIDDAHPVEAVGDGPVDYLYADRVYEVLEGDLAARCRALGDDAALEYAVHVRIGKPAPELLMTAGEIGADLIIVGSHGRTGLRRMVQGSVSEAVVRGAECPVMVVRPNTYPRVKLLPRLGTNGTQPPFASGTGAEGTASPGPAGDEPAKPRHRRGPHIYSYRNAIATKRPNDWPLW